MVSGGDLSWHRTALGDCGWNQTWAKMVAGTSSVSECITLDQFYNVAQKKLIAGRYICCDIVT